MNPFQTLTQFLESYGQADVEGRAMEGLPEELLAGLKAFAAGTLPPEERAQLAEKLKEHPRWVAHLAQEARLLRADEDATAPK